MRPIYKTLLTVCIFTHFISVSIAQTESKPPAKKNFRQRDGAGLFISAQTGTNGMNQQFLNNLIFGGYIAQNKILDAEKNIHKINNSGGMFTARININLASEDSLSNQNKFRPAFVVMEQNNFLGARYDKALWQLLFRGNEPYLGQELKIKNTKIQEVSFRTVGIGFRNLIFAKQPNWISRTEFGFVQLNSVRDLKIYDGSVYTDPDRNFVEARYNLKYLNSGQNNAAGVGYGIYTTWNAIGNVKGAIINVKVKNIGAARVKDASYLSKNMDSTVRINQSDIGLKSFGSADWIEYFKDTLRQELAPDSAIKNNWIMLPFEAELWMMKGQFRYGLHYVYLKGYLPKFTVSMQNAILIKHLGVTPELQLGGFDTYNVNLIFGEFNPNKDYKKKYSSFTIGLLGLEAWLLPKKTHGAGAFGSFRYFF